MQQHALSMILACSMVALSGCKSSSTTSSLPDGSIFVDLDPRTLDAQRPDAGSPSRSLGTPCSEDRDCSGGADVCLIDDSFAPAGYCSRRCSPESSGDECPEGAACLDFSGGESDEARFCLLTCNTEEGARVCREGFGCTSNPFGFPAGFCLPGCSDAADCGEGLDCDPDASSAVAGQCFTRGALPGAACNDAVSCGADGYCFDEELYGSLGGECVVLGCDVAANAGCEDDSQCLAGNDQGICYDGCAVNEDCRAGYRCTSPDPFHPERRVCTSACTTDAQCSEGRVCNLGDGTCAVPFLPAFLGVSCSPFNAGSCPGGTCFRESESGFPGGFCGYLGCTVGDDSTCPSGGSCFRTPGGSDVCGRACESDSDCLRLGYRCLDADWEGPGQGKVCMPFCSDDSHCRVDRELFCNVGAGRCLFRFEGRIGDRCTRDEGCLGGRCLTPAQGWLDGYCTLPGCRLRGDGPANTCPTDSVCADDGYGDPDVGSCFLPCTAEAGCARDGYLCEVPDRQTSGVCRPDPGRDVR